LIPVNFDSVWIYHSWLFLPIAVAFFMTHWEMLKRFAWGMFAVNAVSFLVFLCMPTEAPRPTDLADAPLLYLWTIQMDQPTNACPSLHASVTMLSTIFAMVVLGRFRSAWVWRGLVLLWAGGILWSTLATRQHVFIDIAAGSTLGAIVAFIALRPINEDAWSRPRMEQAY
jgi:membrane-associated phospholipid phosphatase